MALLAQTTLSHDEWRGVLAAAQERFPDLWMPGRSDLCFATTNRQAALKAIAGKADAVVVIGSANSSNTLALERTARPPGAARVLRVNGADELPDDLPGVVGVTAGASAPEELVRAVVDRLAPRRGRRGGHGHRRGRVLPPAPASCASCSGRCRRRPPSRCWLPTGVAGADGLPDDRQIAASDVLDALAR